jgi:hypothetical protein
MKHLLELPGDKTVIIEYFTRVAITSEFEHNYNTAIANKWSYECALDDALFALTYEQGKPAAERNPEKLNILAIKHTEAVTDYEQAVKIVHDMEQTVVPVVMDDRITISVINGTCPGVKISHQDLQTINNEIENLRCRVLSSSKPFHGTSDN